MSIVRVEKLHKNYGEVEAVRGIDFEVKQGEIFGILGPNGAGKTTTLEILEGLLAPSKGEIFIDGLNVVKDTREVKKIIGVQLQQESFFDHLNLKELLEFFANLYNIKSVNAYELLKKVNLENKAQAYIHELSGGQQRRFSLCAVLVNQPKILFLDEPTTGLDPAARRSVWALIKNIRSSGVTIILTTHYMEEANILCDRLAVMHEGIIARVGTPGELIDSLQMKNKLSFASDKFISMGDLQRLYGVSRAERFNGTYQLETIDSMATLYRLLQMGYENDLRLHGFSLEKPTLEDVFLHLTGSKLD